MKPIFKNILAIVLGWATGSIINMSLIKLGHNLYPVTGVDPNDMEALASIMPSLSAEYFIFPFLAHALGTLSGAFVAAKLAASHKKNFALAIGILFLLGGIMVSIMTGGPIWFIILDLVVAYIPMALLGYKFATK